MISKPNAIVLVDANFWIALLFEKEDSVRRKRANLLFDSMRNKRILIPWPTMHETFIDKNIKNKHSLESFQNVLKRIRFRYLYDKSYRVKALASTFEYNMNPNLKPKDRRISLTDMIIRYMIDDDNIKKDVLVSFNEKDFSDICRKKSLEILF
jgi:predicted nucleic acid-binding protein